MKFSLIVSTRGRVAELERLLQSLAAQTCQDFQVIVSDQNEDDRLAPLIERTAWGERLLHLKSTGGVSRGRNAGIARATGEILCFPDDDCVYPPELLEDVASFFSTHPEFGYLTGRSFADDGKDAVSRHASQASRISRYRVYQQCIEFAMFFRRAELGETLFDENLGPGAPTPWQADEGPDLLLRLEAQGVRGYYDPRFAAWHPRPVPSDDQKSLERAYGYSRATGYLLRKHHYPGWFFAYLTGRTWLGLALSLLTMRRAKVRVYQARLRGRRKGWTDDRPGA